MGISPQGKNRRARQLIALTLLAELQTNQRNLLSLILDKATLWAEDRQALRLPPLSREVERYLAMSQGPRLYRLRDAVFRLAPLGQGQPKRLIYRDDIYQPGAARPTRRH